MKLILLNERSVCLYTVKFVFSFRNQKSKEYGSSIPVKHLLKQVYLGPYEHSRNYFLLMPRYEVGRKETSLNLLVRCD